MLAASLKMRQSLCRYHTNILCGSDISTVTHFGRESILSQHRGIPLFIEVCDIHKIQIILLLYASADTQQFSDECE